MPFLDTIVKQLPKLVFGQPDIQSLGSNLYRIKVPISINSFFPTHSGPAIELQDVQMNRWNIRISDNQSFESGFAYGTFGILRPGEIHELDFVVQGTGKMSIVAGYQRIGYSSINLVID